MSFRRPHLARTPAAPATSPGSFPSEALYRQLERKRRRLHRPLSPAAPAAAAPRSYPISLLARLTLSSFLLQQLAVSTEDVTLALSPAADHRAFRPPKLLRIRNHVAILRSIERLSRGGQPLKLPAVVRWYTSISCGLSIGQLDDTRLGRLEQLLRRLNSPQLRLQQALPEIATLHVRLLADPLFPGFNGLLSRLLLQYHLARCNLPPVLFEPADAPLLASDATLLPRLLQLLLASCDLLLGADGRSPS